MYEITCFFLHKIQTFIVQNKIVLSIENICTYAQFVNKLFTTRG